MHNTEIIYVPNTNNKLEFQYSQKDIQTIILESDPREECIVFTMVFYLFCDQNFI